MMPLRRWRRFSELVGNSSSTSRVLRPRTSLADLGTVEPALVDPCFAVEALDHFVFSDVAALAVVAPQE